MVNGDLTKPEWQGAAWSEHFGRIDDGSKRGQGGQVAFLWDADFLYVGFRIPDRDIRGSAVVHHEQIYMKDDDAEIFINGEGRYYELGVNPLNTIYEYRWTWLEPLVENRDFAAIEALMKTPDILYYCAREGEKLGRHGDMGWEMPGLKHAVRLQGSLNCPDVEDDGWTVEFGIPWAGLQEIGLPAPEKGMVLRAQGYRAEHDFHDERGRIEMDRYWQGATPYMGYTWSAMGNGNVHNPERWAKVTLA